MPEENARLALLERKLFGGDPYVWDGRAGLLGEFLTTLKDQKATTEDIKQFVERVKHVKVKNDAGEEIDFVEMVKIMYEGTRKKQNRWKTYGQVAVYIAATIAAIKAFLDLMGT